MTLMPCFIYSTGVRGVPRIVLKGVLKIRFPRILQILGDLYICTYILLKVVKEKTFFFKVKDFVRINVCTHLFCNF